MTELEAIGQRQSRRSYLNTAIPDESIHILNEFIKRTNEHSGLSIQLVMNDQSAFQGFRSSYGMFQGVQNYFALVGKQEDINLKEKVGYYGELLVLEATKLGLGTCWVAGTYNKSNCPCTILKNETLVCIITVGNVAEQKALKEKFIYRLAHRGTKALKDMYSSDCEVPNWFIFGMEAVQKAPSAVNRQPVFFEYKKGSVTASIKNTDRYQAIDFGIAKAHFEIGAGGKFDFGNGASFHKF